MFFENCTQGFGGKIELKWWLFIFGSLFQQALDVVLKREKQIAAMEKKGLIKIWLHFLKITLKVLEENLNWRVDSLLL